MAFCGLASCKIPFVEVAIFMTFVRGCVVRSSIDFDDVRNFTDVIRLVGLREEDGLSDFEFRFHLILFSLWSC